MKLCSCCKCKKEYICFGKNRRARDGHQAYCKACTKKNDAERYQRTRELQIARGRQYRARIAQQDAKVNRPAKKCAACKNNKNMESFAKNKYSIDKRNYVCKSCVSKNRRNITHNRAETKRCCECLCILDISQFYKNKYYKDGHRGLCVKCTAKRERTIKYKITRRVYASRYKAQKRRSDPAFKMREAVGSAVNFYLKRASGSKQGTSVLKHLPYTMRELKEHLESQFEPWMNWSNYGPASTSKKTWQIDHIIPQSKLLFDSFNHPNFMRCWNLNNIRPMESIPNIKKSNKYIL